jgi:hypothetical protein
MLPPYRHECHRPRLLVLLLPLAHLWQEARPPAQDRVHQGLPLRQHLPRHWVCSSSSWACLGVDSCTRESRPISSPRSLSVLSFSLSLVSTKPLCRCVGPCCPPMSPPTVILCCLPSRSGLSVLPSTVGHPHGPPLPATRAHVLTNKRFCHYLADHAGHSLRRFPR